MNINEMSRVSDVVKTSLGYDILNKALITANQDPKILEKPFVRSLKLKHLKRFLGKEFVEALIELLNLNADETYEPIDKETPAWYKEAVFYQIYPKSFKDSNGDGIGDLRGIIEKLDYLQDLGINALWLCPIYDSPLADNGYDIRDYRKILATFGTMDDFDELLSEVHQRRMRLIMDLVVNHTSDEHEWFKACLDGDPKYRDYYIIKDQPNNWTSWFSGPAWRKIDDNHYALHLFAEKQIDLNFDNPNVRDEVVEIVKFWLDKGVDGFRMDVINLISKNNYLDGDETIYKLMGIRGIEKYFYGPKLHEYLKEIHERAFAPYHALSVGEAPGIGLKTGTLMTHPSRHELDMLFNFDGLETPGHARFDVYDFDLRYLKKYYQTWMEDYPLGCQMALFFENHDNPRMVSKVDHTLKYREPIAKLLAMMQLTLKGTPFIFQGQELGMTNNDFQDIDEINDIESKNKYLELGGGPKAFEHILYGSRDHARTPMAFDDSLYGGFSNVKPWLKSHYDYAKINVKCELADANSVLNFYKKLIAFRKEHIEDFAYSPVRFVESSDDIMVYHRNHYEIILNLTNQNLDYEIKGTIIFDNYTDFNGILKPYQGLIVFLD